MDAEMLLLEKGQALGVQMLAIDFFIFFFNNCGAGAICSRRSRTPPATCGAERSPASSWIRSERHPSLCSSKWE